MDHRLSATFANLPGLPTATPLIPAHHVSCVLDRVCVPERISKHSPGLHGLYDIMENSLFSQTLALRKVSTPRDMTEVKST